MNTEVLVDAFVQALVSNTLQIATEKLRQAFTRDPQRVALRRALKNSLDRFGVACPELAASLFDEHFLSGGASPVLQKFLKHPRVTSALAGQLADAFLGQLSSRPDHPRHADLLPAARAFLRYFSDELRAQPE